MLLLSKMHLFIFCVCVPFCFRLAFGENSANAGMTHKYYFHFQETQSHTILVIRYTHSGHNSHIFSKTSCFNTWHITSPKHWFMIKRHMNCNITHSVFNLFLHVLNVDRYWSMDSNHGFEVLSSKQEIAPIRNYKYKCSNIFETR